MYLLIRVIAHLNHYYAPASDFTAKDGLDIQAGLKGPNDETQ
ncbi:MAG: hypothetical protein AAGI25_17715 [Bacteroidota bacterium]